MDGELTIKIPDSEFCLDCMFFNDTDESLPDGACILFRCELKYDESWLKCQYCFENLKGKTFEWKEITNE